jgi:hypothetical protein
LEAFGKENKKEIASSIIQRQSMGQTALVMSTAQKRPTGSSASPEASEPFRLLTSLTKKKKIRSKKN